MWTIITNGNSILEVNKTENLLSSAQDARVLN